MASSLHEEVDLNDDMWVEILTKLPFKSYASSKCVSTSWRRLLSGDYARSRLPCVVSGILQSSSAEKSGRLTYVATSSNDSKLETALLDDLFPAVTLTSSSALIDCSNGLLLFYSSSAASFHVCCPATKKYVKLAPPSMETKLSILAFDPRHSKHFKVVSFAGWRAQGAELELFDSASGSWARRSIDWGFDTNALSSTMSYAGGVLYILAQPRQAVLAVNLDDDTVACSIIPLPEVTTRDCCVAKVGGRLQCCVVDEGRRRLRIWRLREEEGGWELRHCVNVKIKNGDMGELKVLGMDNVRGDVVYLWGKGRLVAFDVCEGREERSWELEEEEEGYLVGAWVFPFMEDCLDASRQI